MLSIGVQVDLTELRALLAKLTARSGDLRAWFAQYLSPEFDAMMAQQFATGGAYLGRPWQKLAPSTIARKGHAKILQDSEEMMRAFSDASHPDALVIMGGLTFSRTVRGRARRLGLIHSDPDAVNRPRLPLRPVLPGIPGRLVTTWSGSLRRYLLTGRVS